MKPVIALALCCLLAAAPAAAQEVAADATPAQLDDVIVTARLSGAPMWTVTRGDGVLVLVGSIRSIPRDVTWRPEALEQAAASADQILLPPEGRASLSDLFRIIWRARTIALIPNGGTTADYLSAEDQARLEALMASERNDNWRRRGLLFLGMDLMQDKAGFRAGREGADAVDVVRRAGRRARVEMRPVGTVRGDDMVEGLISAPQTTHQPCVEKAIAAAEAGPEASRERAQDWRAYRVAEVVASPIEQALKVCWPWSDPDIGPVLHQQWAAAIETALVSPGVTLAVAPVRLLAETDGVLDQLEARGFEIEGPEWK